MASITHAELTAQLVTGCLAMIQDKAQGQLPVKGHVLTQGGRAELGVINPFDLKEASGETIIYPIDGGGVFLDMGGAMAMVWFKGHDCDRALALVEAAVKAAYPQTEQKDDRAHPDGMGMRVRLHRIDMDPARVATIELSYPEPNGPTKEFVARIRAQIRKDALEQVKSMLKN